MTNIFAKERREAAQLVVCLGRGCSQWAGGLCIAGNQTRTFVVQAMTTAQRDTQISLVEIIVVLIERKRLIIGVTLAFTLAGILLVLLQPRYYVYETTLRIGGVLGEQGIQPVISPSRLAKMVNVGYLLDPESLNKEFPILSSLEIQAQDLGGVPLIRIEAKARLKDEIQVISLLEAVNARIAEKAEQLIDLTQRRQLGLEIKKLEFRIRNLKGRLQRDQAKLKRLDRLAEQFRDKLTDLEKRMSQIILQQKEALREETGEMRALAYLISGNEYDSVRREAFRLEEQLLYVIPEQKGKLENAILSTELQIAELETELTKTNAQLENFRSTQPQIPPRRSLNPLHTGNLQTIVAFLVMGIFLGLCSVFIVELVSSVKPKLSARYLDQHPV